MRHFSFILLVLCSFITSLFANITTSTHQSVQTSLRNKGRSRITMQIEAIYQFGDSLSDTGNLVRETTRVKPAFARLPYGQTFFHRPTGRCSDGLLMVDYFGMFYGIFCLYLFPYIYIYLVCLTTIIGLL